jgi:hypothetical protein
MRGLARAQEGSGQVDRDDLLPLLQRHVDELEGLLDPGVVDQQVEPAEGLADLGEAALDVGLDRDVHLDGHRAPAGGLDGSDHRAAVVDLAAVVDGDRGAVGGELEGGPLAYAGGGAGDQGAAPLEQTRIGWMEVEVVIGHPRGFPH